MLVANLEKINAPLTDHDFYLLSYDEQAYFVQKLTDLRRFTSTVKFREVIPLLIAPGELRNGVESKHIGELAKPFLKRYFGIMPSGLDLKGDDDFFPDPNSTVMFETSVPFFSTRIYRGKNAAFCET